MTNSIKVTAAQANEIAELVAANKTPWVIVNGGQIVQVYSGRTQAREDKAARLITGQIGKASDYKLEAAPVETAPAEADKPAAAPKRNIVVTHESTIQNPCKQVWNIATEMKEANPNVKRGEILDACVKAGIAYYTARTQYQQWLGVQKEMAERIAAQSK